VVLGFVTSALIFPKVLLKEEIGLLGILVSYSIIFAQFSSLGVNTVIIKLFPYFQNREKNHNGILFIGVVTAILGFLLSVVILFIIKPFVVQNANDTSTLLSDYYYYLFPLVFFTLFFNLFDSYFRVLMSAVIGTFTKEFLQRVFIFGSIILFFYGAVDFRWFVLLYVSSISMPTVLLFIMLVIRREFSLKPPKGFLTKDLSRHMLNVGFFGILSGFAGVVTLNVDRIMVERFLGLDDTGIYTTAFYFATLVIMPQRALVKIAGPMTARAWKENDRGQLFMIYQKSCTHLYLVGLFILAGLWVNVSNIFEILPPDYAAGKYVILFIGLAYLFDMAAGVSQQVLMNSDYFRYQSYFLGLMMALIISLNLIFIPPLGLTGAAIASALAKLLTNIARYLFILYRFNLQPYNLRFLVITLIGLASYLSGSLLTEFTNLYLDIIVRSTLITVVFWGLTLIFRISDEVNGFFRAFYSIFQRKDQSN
jgi:O-antigen/teichoic acid export membrane protein